MHTNTVLMNHISDEGYHSVEDISAIIDVMISLGCSSATWTRTDIAIAIYIHNQA